MTSEAGTAGEGEDEVEGGGVAGSVNLHLPDKFPGSFYCFHNYIRSKKDNSSHLAPTSSAFAIWCNDHRQFHRANYSPALLPEDETRIAPFSFAVVDAGRNGVSV